MTEQANIVDSHCHLDLEQFDEDRPALLERARAAGVRLIVNPGIDLHHCRQAIALAEQIAEQLDARAQPLVVHGHSRVLAGQARGVLFDGGLVHKAGRIIADQPRACAAASVAVR